MKRNFVRLMGLLVLPAAMLLSSCGEKYKYETVPNDPMKTRIYTLDNGLKVYLSVNKDAPRIQTVIAVNAGGKNDPAETTGLAHYFEHLMFKGTEKLGTINYEAEKVYLDQIQDLFEVYRKTTGDAERAAIYRQIDSVSQIAATYAIPNEYDKMMSAIGSQGTNAFTSQDITAYIEDIPANQIENWAKIQSDRFQHPVIRLFHTELETVYEEYNMYKASDNRQLMEKMFTALFPHHPYGTQTVLGTPEQLKSPSIVNIKKFFGQYYVPNNMAVIMVGDLDPDKTIAIIDQYFGQMESKKVPEFKYKEEKTMTANVSDTVIGKDPAMVAFAYPLPSPRNEEVAIAELVSSILTNGSTGLYDVNLNQQQKVMVAQASYLSMADYGMMLNFGMPRQGQTLEEVRDLMLQQVDLLKKGEFSEDMLKAVVDNFVVDQYHSLRSNMDRAMLMMNAFNYHEDWEDVVNNIDRLSKVTKEQVVAFANKYLNNYAIIYKLEGPADYPRIEKPQITPLPINRDTASAFLTEIRNSKPAQVDPVFVDFKKDLTVSKYQDKLDLLYKKNEGDPLFSLYYIYEMGSNHDMYLKMAFDYLPYLGTDKYTAEELTNEFYKLAANYRAIAEGNRVYVILTGIDKNFEASLELFEHLMSSVKADPQRYAGLAYDILKIRMDAKKTQQENLRRLMSYALYGPVNPMTRMISQDEILSMDPNKLTDKIKGLKNYEHTIAYFGPESMEDLKATLAKHHTLPQEFLPIPEKFEYEQRTPDNTVFYAHYDAPQVNVGTLMKGAQYDKDLATIAELYNAYFGGGSMSGIVFQEIREARALAYTSYCFYFEPNTPDKNFIFQSFLGTQTDKMKDGITAFDSIIQDMPLSQTTFDLAKQSLLDGYRNNRTLRESTFFTYLRAKEWGFNEDPAKYSFEKIQNYTLDDVKKFQEEYIKGQKSDFVVLGNKGLVDMNYLKSLGSVKELSSEEIFGY